LGLDRVLVSETLYTSARFRRLVVDNPRVGDVEVLSRSSIVKVDRPVFGRVGWPTPELGSWLTDHIAPAVAASPERRLLIVRGRDSGRSFVNRDEVEQIAKSRGFDAVMLEDYSFEDQIELFASARVVVGVHGAGLANLVFRGRRPLTVLELVPDTMSHAFYYNLVRCLGGDYRAIRVGSTGAGVDYRLKNVAVAPGQLDRALAELP
jgi:capsular polysaccharide biosynthesis protein